MGGPMYWKSVLAVAATMLGGLAAAPAATADGPAPHEKTYTVPGGFEFTVGNTENVAHPIPALNGMPTVREVMLDDTAYGKVIGTGKGHLKTGYFVACAVELKPKLDLNTSVGFSASATAGVDLSPAALLPSIDLSAGPTVSGSIGLDLPLQPGKVTDVPVGEKDLSDGVTGSIISKDFHIRVEDCAGPLTIQAYTTITAESPAVTGMGAVVGDPTVL
ncbi:MULTISPECIES: MspA family porin [unclassified Nocardia]|uniref:MspA family porin n=1 Tax=unclassified Nocardia TaxID=2637762 RepID=UPI001CE45EF6|nr:MULTISPECIES: MspA family porin [unclassified Nocardia]